ncbi:hypothetical protein Fmac_024911 [Flemingia macrophylla]|uniref:Uncharacterized protein n=1 Tax=Flemingia macrophylla TaxID=520843 RepID=A0ABD1LQU6_9FABA
MSVLRLMLQTSIAGHHRSRGQTLDREDEFQLLAVSVQELMHLSFANLVTQLAVNHKHTSVARVCGIRSSNDHHQISRNDGIVIRGANDVATDTYAETRKVEGKLDPLVNLVAQPVVNQKPACVHPKAYAANIYSRGVHDLATDTSVETRKVEAKLDALVNLVAQLTVNQKIPLLKLSVASVLPMKIIQIFSARNDAIVIRGVHDVAIDTSAETRKVEGKQDVLVNLVTQQAVNQNPTYVARVYGIHSSNDHHTNRFDARNDPIVIRGVHDVAIDTFAENRKVDGKLDALVILVTQLTVNQKSASVARVHCHHCSRGQTLDREDDFQLLAVTVQEMMPLSLEHPGVNEHPEDYAANIYSRVHNGATDTSAETGKVEGKLDALVNLVTQLAVNQKSAYVARVCGISSSNDHHTNRIWHPTPSSFGARNDAIVIREVHDVAIDTSTESRKVEGKLDVLVNLVTQLAVNQKPTSVARVYGIRSSNDHHTNFFHDVASDTSAETRKMEGKLDDLVNLVAQLAVNQRPASIARVCGIRFPITNIQMFFSARSDVIAIRGVHDLVTDTSAENRKVEGKLYALVNLVTQLAVNQKPAFIARVYGIRSSNDHHTNTSTAAEARHLIEKMASNSYGVRNDAILAVNQKSASVARVCGIRSSNDHHTNVYPSSCFGARNDVIFIRGIHDVATDTSAEPRKVEGKLDARVNLVIHLAVNQNPASVARQPGVDEHAEAYAANDAIDIGGVYDVATKHLLELKSWKES